MCVLLLLVPRSNRAIGTAGNEHTVATSASSADETYDGAAPAMPAMRTVIIYAATGKACSGLQPSTSLLSVPRGLNAASAAHSMRFTDLRHHSFGHHTEVLHFGQMSCCFVFFCSYCFAN